EALNSITGMTGWRTSNQFLCFRYINPLSQNSERQSFEQCAGPVERKMDRMICKWRDLIGNTHRVPPVVHRRGKSIKGMMHIHCEVNQTRGRNYPRDLSQNR